MERGRREGGAEGKERKREEAETARFGSTTRLTLRRRPGRLRGCRSTLLLGHPYPHPYPRGWIEAGRPIFRAPLDSSSPLVAALSPSRVTSHPPAVVRAYVHTRNAAPCRRTTSHKRSIRGDGEENRRERIPDKRATVSSPFSPRARPANGPRVETRGNWNWRRVANAIIGYRGTRRGNVAKAVRKKVARAREREREKGGQDFRSRSRVGPRDRVTREKVEMKREEEKDRSVDGGGSRPGNGRKRVAGEDRVRGKEEGYG